MKENDLSNLLIGDKRVVYKVELSLSPKEYKALLFAVEHDIRLTNYSKQSGLLSLAEKLIESHNKFKPQHKIGEENAASISTNGEVSST